MRATPYVCEAVATIVDRVGHGFDDLVGGTRDALTRARMKRAVLAVTVLAATTGTASAGGTYVGLGIGTAPAISEDSDRIESDGRSMRGILGMRWGQWSIEGSLGGNELLRFNNNRSAAVPFGDLYNLSASGKFNLPLGNNFEAFGRLGVNHLVVRGEDEGNNASGNGLLFGGGFEYKLNLGVAGGSIFVDYTINRGEMILDATDQTYDLTTRTWTLGLTIGI